MQTTVLVLLMVFLSGCAGVVAALHDSDLVIGLVYDMYCLPSPQTGLAIVDMVCPEWDIDPECIISHMVCAMPVEEITRRQADRLKEFMDQERGDVKGTNEE